MSVLEEDTWVDCLPRSCHDNTRAKINTEKAELLKKKKKEKACDVCSNESTFLKACLGRSTMAEGQTISLAV